MLFTFGQGPVYFWLGPSLLLASLLYIWPGSCSLWPRSCTDGLGPVYFWPASQHFTSHRITSSPSSLASITSHHITLHHIHVTAQLFDSSDFSRQAHSPHCLGANRCAQTLTAALTAHMSSGQNKEKRQASGLGAEAGPPSKTARTQDRAAKAAAQASAPQAPAAKAAEGSATGETTSAPSITETPPSSLSKILDQMAEAADQQEQHLAKWVEKTKVAVDAKLLRFLLAAPSGSGTLPDTCLRA